MRIRGEVKIDFDTYALHTCESFVLFCLCVGPVTTPLLNLSRNLSSSYRSFLWISFEMLSSLMSNICAGRDWSFPIVLSRFCRICLRLLVEHQ